MITEIGHSNNTSIERTFGNYLPANLSDAIYQDARDQSGNFKTESEKRNILLDEINDRDDLSTEQKIRLAKTNGLPYSFVSDATLTRFYLTIYKTQEKIGYTSDRNRRFVQKQS